MANDSYRSSRTLRIEAGGHSLAYREIGPRQGVPIVFLQHLTGNLDDWDPAIVDGLAKQHHVITFDNVGVGASSGKTPSSVEEMARDAGAFIDALKLERVDLFGFSLGGFIAPLIARSRPKLVRRMVLAGASAAGGQGLVDIVGVFQGALERAGQLNKHPKRLLFFTPTARSQAAADAFLARLEARREDRDAATTMEAIQSQLAAIVAWGRAPLDAKALGTITQPTLISNGDRDVMVPTANSFTLFEALPNAQLSIFPDSGHGGVFQYHGEFLEQVLRFLAD
jgi:pimeloyl-ACP methyl ester carboxylesterase